MAAEEAESPNQISAVRFGSVLMEWRSCVRSALDSVCRIGNRRMEFRVEKLGDNCSGSGTAVSHETGIDS